MIMSRTFRWRIALPYALLITAIIVGLSLYVLTVVHQAYQDSLETNLTAEARLFADQASTLMTGSSNTDALTSLARRYAGLWNAHVAILRPDGTVVVNTSSTASQSDNLLIWPEVKGALTGEVASQTRFNSASNQDMLYLAAPIFSGGQVVGAVRLAVSLNTLNTELAVIRQAVLIATSVAIILTIFLSIFMSGYILRPLSQLTEAIRRMTVGDFTETKLASSHDEIGQLNQAFNHMATQLRTQIDALQTESAKLAAVLAHMTDGVVIVDGEGEVQLINPAAERMFDVQGRDALGHSLVEIVRHHQIVELWRQSRQAGEQQVTTLELPAEKLFIQIIATSLKQALPGSTLLLFQDLTRLRRLETIRQDFISNVSHELRTPLASLKALTETLQEGALEDPPAAQRFLLRMETEIDTLTQMVTELLELSRIESGKVPIQRKSLDPLELIKPSVERMRLQAERAGLELKLECPAELPRVVADADRVEQVLINILHNAIKFTPSGGKIVVSAYAEDGRVVFYVKDTGVGIQQRDLSRIFERFYKTDRARSGGGTGLGLSIARHIIEAHGGRIWAESSPGQGSTFFFTLPVL